VCGVTLIVRPDTGQADSGERYNVRPNSKIVV
jgi:hypothetical protein